ncbi:MAG TPA: site-2 protease family protein [Vicinamibacterales bacterium]|nr:site-2 protease family protein [Vicinamibacterales bacterium]
MNIDPVAAVIGFGVLLISLTVHEAAHAWTADRLGDPTARVLGRVSLNPLVHIDPIGTVLLPLIAAFSHLPLIGWAKPVPVSFRNLRHPRRDFMMVAAAGPVSNLLQAVVAAMILRLFAGFASGGQTPASTLTGVLYLAVEINLLLAFFNLIPVPPLDGGNVMLGLLPPRAAATYSRLRQYGFIVLYALLLTGIASALIMPPTMLLLRILLP